MRPQPESCIVINQAADLPLSGPALRDLMRAVLARGVPFRFRARGGSMAPFIRDGDVITVSPFRADLGAPELGAPEPGAGDIVAFVQPATGHLVVHRVVARRGAAWFIRGDGVPGQADGLIPARNILGRVTRIQRQGRDISLGLGPERAAIAWLSRASLLIPLRRWLAACRRRKGAR